MNRLEAEIARVEAAIAKTKSPYLKKDYGAYLAKLRRQLEAERKKNNG